VPILGERTEQLDIFCRGTGFTSDFLSFIVVEYIRFFHGALQSPPHIGLSHHVQSLCVSVPNENVATMESSACVIEGVSRSRNALINGDTKNYDWDSGYTCHQLGSGSIVVQLAQPYVIGSMRCVNHATCMSH